MTDRGRKGKLPRSGARDGGAERQSAARSRTRGRQPREPQAQRPTDPGPSWQAPAPWFDDRDVTDGPVDLDADLVNLGFIGAALRRSKRWWIGLAVLGLLLGVAVWAARPPTPEASTSLLLDVGPESQPGTAILNDKVMAQSRGVAATALHTLGLRQSIESLQATYTASVVTDQVLLITAAAPTTSEAVSRANAIASAFLAFRADQLRQQQALQFTALDDVLTQSERDLAAIDAHISRVAQAPASGSQKAQIQSLRATRDRANSALLVLKGQVDTAKATAEETTAAMVGKSGVLDRASPVEQSRLKPLVLFSGAGFVIGLCLGAGLVILRALVSDRLRRRDDVARALGAPVRLSIPTEPWYRRRPGRRGLTAARGRDVRRIVTFLRGILPTGSAPGALAVVPVDETRVAALAVTSLATAMAQASSRVVVADLCDGSPVAKLVGVKGPGLHTVQVDGAQIEVVIPDPDVVEPVGPFGKGAARPAPALAAEVATACESADVLLTLAGLDPSLTGDHLRTWAADAVVVVTAGRSTWTKVHAVGELARLAGTRLVCAVLVGADKRDESLGVKSTQGAPRDASAGNDSTEATSLDDPTTSRFMRG